MSTTLAVLAELVGGRLNGDPSLVISGTATLSVVSEGEITLTDSADLIPNLLDSAAAAAVVSSDLEVSGKPSIAVDNVHQAFAKIVEHFRPRRKRSRIGLSPQAIVSPTAKIGKDVDIHPMAIVGDDVVLGQGSTIHGGVHIQPGCVLGENVTLFPNVVLYEDTQIGDRSIIHSGVVLGAYGFGYSEEAGGHKLSAQLGYVVIGDDVEIGACATVDRGTYGPTVIGDGTKIDNLVQIAHNCRIGKHNLICSQVGIAGSTTTGDQVVMAGQVGIRDHVHIGKGAILCSKAGVSNNIEEGEIVLGQPATPLRKQKLQMAAISKLPEMRKDFRQLQKKVDQLVQETTAESSDETPNQAA